MTGERPALDGVAVAEPKLDLVDLVLDDGRRIDRAADERTRVSPPPQGLSRGKVALSSEQHLHARRGKWCAVAEPAGPPPTTSTSKRCTA